MTDSRYTSSTDVSGNENFLLAITETFDDRCPLFHLHLAAEQRHLVAFSGQLSCQPPGGFPGLG